MVSLARVKRPILTQRFKYAIEVVIFMDMKQNPSAHRFTSMDFSFGSFSYTFY